ncbi:1-phosphatidylinositol 4,5-bisphosphate phosphodiesterase delta-3-A isoform X1 [Acipenser ruthenus]|uniref:1-phosphatidylinositol 4,5-bisphosphate phosphodiesterase delta-3-A isoform X1 n=1 Tax=Acipenser ruthenus TaxID=7906 RepID=UPI00145B064F|nr:1-phosphatidylinositol 4,5-bisphosphate phosphodiesterase delta-3-A isoform X1 [Acipenser ruthenus]
MMQPDRSKALEVDATKRSPRDLRALRKLGVTEDDDVRFMLLGSSLWKIRSPRWQKRRELRLQEDGMTVWCETHKRSKRAPSQQTFSVMDVQCVLEGCQSEVLRGLCGSIPEALCFTVVFRGPRRGLDLACNSEEEARHWIRGLRKLQERGQTMSQRDKLEHWIYGYLRRADADKDNTMSFKEVKSLLRMINIEVTELYARQLFKQCDRSGNDRLENSEIEEFCRRLTRRPELEALFCRCSGEDCVLSDEELLEFLREQGEEATLSQARELIQKYELNDTAKQQRLMMLDGFLMYLLSKEGDVFNPAHATVYQDMSQPLSHYFISSSHNTYLLQDQLGGPSSTEAYIRALSRGCRCVELDCWEGPNGEPIVYHGHTLTSRILFREVIEVVRDYAFQASPYPLILSLENHCGREQQVVMARHLRSILGETLLTKSPGSKGTRSMPSPEELKGRILVKGKKLSGQQVESDSSSSSSDSSSCSEEEEPGEGGGTKTKNKKKKKKEYVKSCSSSFAPELSDLVLLCRSVRFRGFDHASQQPANEMSSFSEGKARRLIRDFGNSFVRHNARQLSRIYPSGLRAHSSNYSPQEMWNAGCQIVALNFQTPGEAMALNQGRFLQNGRCGYTLKPAFLRSADSIFDPEHPTRGQGYQAKTLTITVISAQQLPKLNPERPNSIVDPLVRVELHGLPADNARAETPHINNNGFNPQWNHTLVFDVGVPELALVRFVVEDHDTTSSNDFVGQFTLPFTSLRQGYRHIHLLSADGVPISPASLFVHIKVSELSRSQSV